MEQGELHVSMDVGSDFLSRNLPFLVRDASLTVVHRATCGTSAALPEGLYSVSVLAADGERDVRHAQVRRNETTTVSFSDPAVASTLDSAPDATPGSASLLSMTGCATSLVDAHGWEFVPVTPLGEVPWAEFLAGDRIVEMSLPLNPTGGYPLTSCRVDVDGSGRRPDLRVAFAPGRLVTRLVGGLVRHGTETAGADILGTASSLLLTKYADPAGAALGGLTLHRMGMLKRRRDWVERLVSEFPWLTDGLVLLSALLRDGAPRERRRGRELLLVAARQRPMYTDGLSLSVDLLRRWPPAEGGPERDAALDRLTGLSAYADLDSVTLCAESRGR